MTDEELLFQILQRPIAFHPCLVPICGSITATLFLSQAIYWQRKKPDGGWFYKTREEWMQETFMTRTEQEGARKQLRSRGLLEEKRVGIPATIHYRVRMDEVVRQLNVRSSPSSLHVSNLVENLPTVRQETCQPDGRKPANCTAGNLPSTIYTKTTTETTTETTNKAVEHPSDAPVLPGGENDEPQRKEDIYQKDRFEKVWMAFPQKSVMDKSGGKKGSKTAAWKAWCKVPSGEYEKIEASIKGYRAELEDKAWMPSCALSTYLNQQRWDQYVGEQTTRKDAMRELWDGLIEDQRLNPDKVTKGDFARGVDKCMDAGWSTQQIYTAWENYLYINQNNAFQQGIIRFLAPENIEQFTKMSDERVEALRKEQDQSSKERR